MPILRFLVLPLRLALRVYYSLRNLARGGDVLFHELPDRFTMLRPSGMLAYFAPRPEMHFVEYQALLRVFAESDTLSTLVYTVPDIEASWAEVEQIGRALEAIDLAGKQLIAYGEGGNLKSLYLMSFARRRYAAPFASYVLNYPATEGYFLKNTIERFGVKVETHHAGKFKAEGFEMFTRTGYSPAARKNLKDLLGDFRARIDARLLATPGELKPNAGSALVKLAHRQILAETAEIRQTGFFDAAVGAAVFQDWIRAHLIDGRPADPESAPDRLPPEEIDETAQHPFAPVNPAESAQAPTNSARAAKSLKADPGVGAERDAAADESEQYQELRRLIKQEARARRRVTNERALYRRHQRRRFAPLRLRSPGMLALVTMDGPISMGRAGEAPRGYGIPALPFRELIRNLEESREEAVFLYINSPGGGADASELLFDSIYRLSRIKPVFAVVGSVAASGGYYLACAANRIYASPLSLLGSIGVIRIRPNLAGLYKKLGVKREALFRDPTGDLFSEAGALSPASVRLMKSTMQSTYSLFLKRVAQGRGQSVAAVSRQAEGRVFSGERFQAAAMIDGACSFIEALEIYRAELGYPEGHLFRLNYYPEVRADLRSLAGFRGGLSAAAMMGARTILNPGGFPVDQLAGAALPGSAEGRLLADLEVLLRGSPQLAYAPWREVLRDT